MRRPFNSERSRCFCSFLALLLCLGCIPSPEKFSSLPGDVFADEAIDQPFILLNLVLLEEAKQLDSKVAELYKMGKAEEALPLAKRALVIHEQILGPTHPDTATSLNNLGVLLRAMGDLAGAKPYFERALAIHEQVLGLTHPETANSLNNLGMLLFALGELTEAKAYLDQALAIHEQVLGPTHPETATSLNNLGGLLQTMGDLAGAKSYYERALAIYEQVLGPTHPETATILINLGTLLKSMGDYAGAKPYYERALAIREKVLGPDHPYTAINLNSLGGLLQTMGDLSGAKPCFERALAIHEQVLGPTHPETANSLNNLGGLLQTMGDLAGAKPYFERALAIHEQVLGPTHPETATSLNNLGMLLQDMGDYAGAKPYFERALAIHEQVLGPTHPKTATSLNNLGGLLQVMGDYAGAKPYYERTLAIDEQILGATHPETATSLNNLGLLLKSMGDYDGAKPYFERALAIDEQVLGLTHPYTATSLINLGGLLQDMGDYDGAKPYFERALAIHEQALGPTHPETATSVGQLGALLQVMGDYAGAKPYYERALAIHEQVLGPTHPYTATSLNNLGALLKSMGDLAGAKPYFERALAIHEQVLGPTHPETANSLNNLGALLHTMGNLTEAKPYFERSLAIRERVLGPTHPATVNSLNNLGLLLQTMGELKAAMTVFSRAMEAEEQSLAATLAIGTEVQKRAFLQTLTESSYGSVSLLVHSAPKDEQTLRLATTTVLRRKGRALDATTEGLRLIRANSDPASRTLFERFKSLRNQWAYLQLHPPEKLAPEERHKKIAELEKELRSIEGQLSAQSAAFRKKLTPISLEDVQSRISNQAALVEFYVYKPFDVKARPGKRWGDPNYFAFVLRRSGAPRWVALGPADPIDEAAEALRDSVATLKEDLLESARQLDALTMAKIRPLLGDAETLLISPDGALNLVPFAALVDEEGKYLIEKYQLSYLASGRDLLRTGKESEVREQPLLVGNADFNGALGTADRRGNAQRSADMTKLSFGELPGTDEEVREIGQLLKLSSKQILTQEQATEAAVKSVKGPEILHLATHGFFLPDIPEELPESGPVFSSDLLQPSKPSHRIEDPLLRSGLALSGFNHRDKAKSANDGVLTALEAAGLDLWGTEIVTLSACETGIGEVNNGEGVFGLRRALVLAGAQSQLMTLWSVSDEPTKDLMVSWYGQLMAGKGRAEALRQIQLAALRGEALPVIKRALRGKRGVFYAKSSIDPRIAGTRHPFFWASLILSGATGPIHGTTK